jgi:acyl carrier protein
MTTDERVVKAIFNAIDEVNQQLPREQRLEKSTQTVLLDDSGKLDSLGLVNLIVSTEQNIEEEFGIAISLVDEEALSRENGPFRDVSTLLCYIARILGEKLHE